MLNVDLRISNVFRYFLTHDYNQKKFKEKR